MRSCLIILVLLSSFCSLPTGQLNLSQVLEAVKPLPITNLTVYDAASDPNHQIGRPNGYLEKASWFDSRLEKKSDVPDCTVEVFASEEDAQRRAEYIRAVTKSLSPLNQYVYQHKNVVLRVPDEMLPEQAGQYHRAIDSL